ncbi:MAG: T9SS type A sorting domain-containing protein [Bacteroidetes bacterium]|nr:T9SS type A sorting domain-containing protein [Bacteroidota bacterium]
MKKRISIIMLALFSFTIAKSQLYTFENWTNYAAGFTSLKVPNGWHAVDSTICFYGAFLNPGAPFVAQVEKELPGNSSATALKVITKNQSALTGIIPAGPFPSLCSNAAIIINTGDGSFSFAGGMSYPNNPLNASMWVKNNPLSGDSTQITILAIDDSDGGDSIAAIADTMLGASINTYTKITLPFKYNASGFNTTMLRIIITSSGNFTNDTTGAFLGLHDGTWLVVDDIDIEAPNGVSAYAYQESIAKVYPTQFANDISIQFEKMNDNTYTFEMYTQEGVKCYSKILNNLTTKIATDEMASATYLYTISKGKRILQSGKLIKGHL